MSSMLYSEDVVDDMQHLPSPEELKYKIIIKAKKTKPVVEEKPSEPESCSEEEEPSQDSSAEVGHLNGAFGILIIYGM